MEFEREEFVKSMGMPFVIWLESWLRPMVNDFSWEHVSRVQRQNGKIWIYHRDIPYAEMDYKVSEGHKLEVTVERI